MDEQSPSFMEENELISFPSSMKVTDKDEYLTWEQKCFNTDNIKNPKKRRLVITTTQEEPILIEIRPNLVGSLAHPLVSNSTQCSVDENRNDKENMCLEHMDLWNKLYQVMHDVNTLNFCEEDWFEKQSEVEASTIGIEKQTDCNEMWPQICTEAVDKIMFLKQNIQNVIKEKQEEKERCSMLLTKQSDVEKQIDLEKDMRNEDCKKLEAVILELKNQVTSQAEEIRRLWIENIANESDELITKSNDINQEVEDTPTTKQRITELEHQLANALEQRKLVCKDQEVQFDYHQLNDNEYLKDPEVVLLKKLEYDHLKLKIEELENEKLQYQEEIARATNKNNNDQLIDYESLVKEHDNLKKKLEKVNNDFNRTTSKLRDNVAKRRRLEAESEGEKEQRSHLAAALYELESEVEITISTINSSHSTAFESMTTLINDLQNFEEALEKPTFFSSFESKISTQNDNEMIKSLESDIKQSPTQSLERVSSNIFKGIPETKSVVSKLIEGHENLLAEISSARKAIHQTLKVYKHQMHIAEKEITSKLVNIESEKETFHKKINVLEEENKSLQEDNSRLQQEVSSLKHAKSTLNLQLKDLEKEMENFQESLQNLREENRRLLKEAKWKAVGKQGGYQESLINQEWEKKLQKLEGDYELLRHAKKDLVKEKHRLEDELDKATEKGYKGLVASAGQNLEEELSNMTQERNKLRKIKITLAIENVSLKESLEELRMQVVALENECMDLPKWKERAQKLEEECEDLRDWKKKAEALEIECKDLRNLQMKIEAQELECQVMNSNIKEFEEKDKSHHETIETVDKECQGICYNDDGYEEECKRLCEGKANLEEECERLGQRICCLEKDQNTFFKFKENLEKHFEKNEFYDIEKLNMDILEYGLENLNENGSKVEEPTKTFHQQGSTNIEHCNIQEYLEKIASLEQENMKLCQNHQRALDKQWDVLQGDLKAFEIKIEELENECESVRRDHLSSMVENAELVREKERLLTMYNDQKYNYEILETSNECLQKDQVLKEAERMKERNDYQSSIDNLNRQIVELESTFSERLHQQASKYELCLAPPKVKTNGRETVTLSRQEYEILLAEKAVMLQERDSAHKKLCSAEVQNLQLSASIECLRKELPCSKKGYKEDENDAEVLLAQDIVNLRSMLSSLEEELESETCERNKLLETNKSLRGELSQLNEALLRCKHENQSLNITLDELKRRSSLEQIHSAASSLKDQLGKASKEKDLIKEQLTRAIKEKEQLMNVANERDKVIHSLKEKIAKLEKGEECSFKAHLQDVSNVPSKINDQSIASVEESGNVKEVVTLKHELLLLNNDLIKKTNLWQKEQRNFEEKCRRLEVDLMNSKEAQAMIKKKMEDDIQEALQKNKNLELIVKNEIKGMHVQVFELQDDLSKAKNFFDEKFELANKEMESITLEINLFLQEMIELKKKKDLVQNEKENTSNNTFKDNEHTKHSVFSNHTLEDANQSNLFVPKTLLEQGIQVILQEDLRLETQNTNHLGKEIMPKLDKTNDELMAVTKENNIQMLTISQFKIEKNDETYHKDTYSCNCNLIQTPKCENKLECCFTLKENHNIQIFENSKKYSTEVTTLNQNLCDFETKIKMLNEQLLDLIGEKDQLTFANQLLLHEQERLIVAIANLEVEKETMLKKFEQDLNLEISSFKALLANEEKEKEILAISKEDLHKKLEDCSICVQSLNEQLETLSYEKNCIIHAKEIITVERDSLLDKYSTLEKKLQTIVKIESKDFQKDANDTFSLTYEQILLLKDYENLIVKIALLRKEEEDIGNKFKIIPEENGTSLSNNGNALDNAQCDLLMKNEQRENLIKENIYLKEENMALVQIKNHFIHECKKLLIQIALVKKDNKEMREIFREEMVQLTLLKNELSSINSKKNEIHGSLIQQPHLLKTNDISQEERHINLEKEITSLKQIIENLVEDRKKQINECEQHNQMKNEYSSFLLSKNNLNKEIIALKENVTALVVENEQLHIDLQASTLKHPMVSMSEEQQICAPNIIEIGILCNMELQHKFQRGFITDSEHNSSIPFRDVDLESPSKETQSFKQQNNELTNEEDNLVILCKTSDEEAHVYTSSIEIETLKQKLMLLNKKYNQVVLDRDNVIQENEFLNEQYKIILAESSIVATNNNNNNSYKESKMAKIEVFTEKSVICETNTSHISLKSLKDEQEKMEKYNINISLENEALTNEKNNLITSISLLKKQYESTLVQELRNKGVTTSEMNLQQKFEELLERVSTLNKSQGAGAEKEFILESLTKDCDSLFTNITSLKEANLYENITSNGDHELHARVDQSMAKNNSIKLEAFPKQKFNKFAKKTISLMKEYIASIKEREKLVSEMISLKRECQKLRTTLIAAERDKDSLMKSVLESRSTIDHIAGEISRLQRESAEADLKLTHLTIERDNANLQIVDLQRLMNNHNRMQHLQESYSLNKFENLEAQKRCLRMEKGNYQFEQPLPSMTNFKIQEIDTHLLSHPTLHNSSQLFLHGVDSTGRPRPPPPSMIHQQWPI